MHGWQKPRRVPDLQLATDEIVIEVEHDGMDAAVPIVNDIPVAACDMTLAAMPSHDFGRNAKPWNCKRHPVACCESSLCSCKHLYKPYLLCKSLRNVSAMHNVCKG